MEPVKCIKAPGGLGSCPFEGGGSVVVDLLYIVNPVVGFSNCSMFCCTFLYVHSSFAIILMGKSVLVALLSFSSWCSRGCCVALPRGAMGLSAVCDSGISWPYSLAIFI